MRVLHVNTDLDPASGGNVERTIQMARWLVKNGIDCAVLATDRGLTPERLAALAGFEVVALPCLSGRFFLPLASFGVVRRLVARADVIHLIGHWSALNVLVFWYARRLRKPYVVCPAGALRIYGRSRVLKRLFNAVVGRRIVRAAAGHIAITRDELPEFARMGIAAERVTVIPNGVDPELGREIDDREFRARHSLGLHPYLLFMGRLNYFKGPDILLEAFLRLKDRFGDYHLVFAGPDEEMREALRASARAGGVADRVHLVGYVEGRMKSEAYHGCRLLVVPSRHEAMSIVVLEAGIAGKPAVITDRCGFDEIEAIGGGAVVAADAGSMAAGIARLLALPEDGFQEMSRRMRDYTSSRYSWPAIAPRVIRLYRDIALGAGGPSCAF